MRAPTREDIEVLVANMRPADMAELLATHDCDPREALQRAVDMSPHCWTMEVNGEVGFIGGFVPVSLLGGVGSPWLLGTTTLYRFPGAHTRIAARYRDIGLGLYSTLVNYVDARNTTSIRWLRRLGFQIADEATPYGPRRVPFYRFELRA